MATNFFRLRFGGTWLLTSCLAAAIGFAALSSSDAAPPTRTTRPGTVPSSRRPTTTAPKTAAPKTTTKPGTTAPKSTGGVFAPPPLPPNGRPSQPATVNPSTAKPSTTKPSIAHPATVKPAELKPAVAAPVPQPPAPQREASKTDAAIAGSNVPANLADADGKYLLRYRFGTGETVRWQVEHTAKIITSVQGSTQTAETVTLSRKAWQVVETRPGGETRFVHAVEAINMKQKLTGRQETTYDSEVDKDIPPMFADAAKQVGVPLAEVVIDSRGQVLKREDKQKRPEGSPTNTITLVLPDKALAIGESWTSPFEMKATDADGNQKSIQARHKLTLEKVEGDVAVLRNETQILSPITDPTIEAQVVQAEQAGHVRFDLRRGRIVSQESDLDKEVFGFQGPESKLHYTARFRETLGSTKEPLTAAGQQPAKSTK